MEHGATIQVKEPSLGQLFYNLQVKQPEQKMNEIKNCFSDDSISKVKGENMKLRKKITICHRVFLMSKRITNDPVEKDKNMNRQYFGNTYGISTYKKIHSLQRSAN